MFIAVGRGSAQIEWENAGPARRITIESGTRLKAKRISIAFPPPLSSNEGTPRLSDRAGPAQVFIAGGARVLDAVSHETDKTGFRFRKPVFGFEIANRFLFETSFRFRAKETEREGARRRCSSRGGRGCWTRQECMPSAKRGQLY